MVRHWETIGGGDLSPVSLRRFFCYQNRSIMLSLQTTSTEGRTPKSRIRDYFTAAFPESKTIKVEKFHRGFRVRLRFRVDGHSVSVFNFIPNDSPLSCLRIWMTFVEKMERYC